MRFREIINEGRDASLFHGYKSVDKALLALKNNEMAATTTQRFWADGKRRKDNDPEYEGSYWMKGISTTRDMRFAMSWGEIMFKLDQRTISQRYKIIPFNWGYSIPDKKFYTPPNHYHKRELEEFIVVKATPDTYARDEEDGGGKDMTRFLSAEGSVKPLSKFLKEIYVGIHGYTKIEEIKPFIEHPLFKGYYKCFNNTDGKIFPPDTDISELLPSTSDY